MEKEARHEIRRSAVQGHTSASRPGMVMTATAWEEWEN
jgi:hypothetical protein